MGGLHTSYIISSEAIIIGIPGISGISGIPGIPDFPDFPDFPCIPIWSWGLLFAIMGVPSMGLATRLKNSLVSHRYLGEASSIEIATSFYKKLIIYCFSLIISQLSQLSQLSRLVVLYRRNGRTGALA